MRRLTAWITGGSAGLAAYRAPAPRPRARQAAEPVANRIRARTSCGRGSRSREVEDGEPAADDSPEERRRLVHEQGRGAMDDMQAE